MSLMETERTPLKKNVPRYTFLQSGIEGPNKTWNRFQYCLWASLLFLIIAILIVILAIFVKPTFVSRDGLGTNTSVDFPNLEWPLPEEKLIEEPILDSESEKRALQMGLKMLSEREKIEESVPNISLDSPSFRHQMATFTSEKAKKMSRMGFLMNSGSSELKKWNKTCEDSRRWSFRPQSPWIPEECRHTVRYECIRSPYRTANGTCNNLQHPLWGAALQPFRRILLPQYNDGISIPRMSVNGISLPSARKVALTIHRPVYKNDINFTVMLAVWGQFIDHDMTATALSKGKNGSPISCCEMLGKKSQHPECFPVVLDKTDPFYKKCNLTCMEFVRSAPAPLCTFEPREQLNQVTSFLDGSVVYGNDDNLMNQLRSFEGGKLKMLESSSGELLPVSTDSRDGCNRLEELKRGRYCFISGDARANENLLLISMHLLLAREHNLIAKELSAINPNWTDEKLFQEARKIVGAEIQHITYNEFLPAIFPGTLMKYLNLTTRDFDYSNDYNSSVNPGIANNFATATFRFGHSLLPGLFRLLRENGTREEYVELHKMLFNPFPLFEKEFLTDFMNGVINTSAERVDVHFNNEVTHKLFQKKENLCGLDLVSLNIQRGRDHGLPSYPNWRMVCGLSQPTSFDDLKNEIDNDTLRNLKKLYNSVNDIDMYTGILAESPVEGGLLGPTATCLLVDQFFRLKVGDKFWYETQEEPQRFSLSQLNEIRKISLAKIICRTSDVGKSQPRVMRKSGPDNEIQPCDSFSFPDLESWRESI